MSETTLAMEPVIVRQMYDSDLPTFVSLVEALARYEKLPPPDAEARDRLVRDAKADPPRFSVLLAERAGRVVAYAVYFETYSTFLASPTLYLEDIFVLQENQRQGVGSALLKELAREAVQRGCGRLEWQVLAWNQPAIAFYERFAALRLGDWQPYRLTHEQFRHLAELGEALL